MDVTLHFVVPLLLRLRCYGGCYTRYVCVRELITLGPVYGTLFGLRCTILRTHLVDCAGATFTRLRLQLQLHGLILRCVLIVARICLFVTLLIVGRAPFTLIVTFTLRLR